MATDLTKRMFSDAKADELINAIANIQKVDKQQGSANAGKALVVGSDGLVGLGDAGLSDASKVALLNCFAHVTWTDAYGQTYYDALERELNRSGGDFETPITSLESLHRGGYVNNTGGVTEQTDVYDYPYIGTYSLLDYFPISPSRKLFWIRGKRPIGSKRQDDVDVPSGQFSIYRIAYYDKDKNFIRRDVSQGNQDLDYPDFDFMEFVCPENAEYIRISWGGTPYPGALIYEFPDVYYNVILDLAKADDSNIISTPIPDNQNAYTNDMTPLVHITRNGVDITSQYIESINPCFSYGVFSINSASMRDASMYDFNRANRFVNRNSLLLKKGDVITCSGKMLVRAERILDGKVLYTPTPWIVNGSVTIGVDGTVLEPVVEEG